MRVLLSLTALLLSASFAFSAPQGPSLSDVAAKEAEIKRALPYATALRQFPTLTTDDYKAAVRNVAKDMLTQETVSPLTPGSPDASWRTNQPDQSGNVYRTKNNPDGTTDVIGLNPRTGSRWDQHIDPATGRQSGHNKDGQFWEAPLAACSSLSTGEAQTDCRSQEESRQIAAQDQRRLDDYNRALLAVMSGMKPGILAEAARAVARRRCTAIENEYGRVVCLSNIR